MARFNPPAAKIDPKRCWAFFHSHRHHVAVEIAHDPNGAGDDEKDDQHAGAELFDLSKVFIETMCLLLSSYTCGLGALPAERRQPARFLIFAVLTFVLGAAFLYIEVSEFAAGRREF
jgi:heme/copper-type cytochrome/quinol oxidase subunit 3